MSADADKDDAIRSLAFSMMHMKELAAPIEEAARGMRAELFGKQGWSEESADKMACEWYVLVMRNIQAQAGRVTGNDETQTDLE